MTLVVDASAAIVALTDRTETGRDARALLRANRLTAPALFRFEVANTLRRHEAAHLIDSALAAEAHENLRILPIQEVPYRSLADRIWELRSNVTVLDAAYVALAEVLDQPLLTVDRRLSRAPGVRCRFVFL